jgi:hypothetical protein
MAEQQQVVGPTTGKGKRLILVETPNRMDRASSKLDKEAVLRRAGTTNPAIAMSPETVDRTAMPQPPERLRTPRTDGTPQ